MNSTHHCAWMVRIVFRNHETISLLTNEPEFSFDLGIFSVIGVGFSDKINKQGCKGVYVAAISHK